MPRLIDDMAEVLNEMRYFITDLEYLSTHTILPLLKRYDTMREKEVEETLLTNAELIDTGANPDSSIDDPDDEPSAYTALSPGYEDLYHPLQSLPVENEHG